MFMVMCVDYMTMLMVILIVRQIYTLYPQKRKLITSATIQRPDPITKPNGEKRRPRVSKAAAAEIGRTLAERCYQSGITVVKWDRRQLSGKTQEMHGRMKEFILNFTLPGNGVTIE